MLFPLFFELLFLFPIIIAHNEESQCTNNTFVRVDVQDVFRQDTISLMINDKMIFDKKVVTSDKVLGLTDLNILLTHKADGTYYVSTIYPSDQKLDYYTVEIGVECVWLFKVVVNNKQLEKEVDLKKGNFLGISTFDGWDEKLTIHQSDDEFFYD